MTTFQHVSDDRLRSILERDFAEMQHAMEGGAFKATIVLAGSIVEALLVNELLAASGPNVAEDALLKKDLAHLVAECVQKNVLSETTEALSIVVRGYRNLIHPGRELRTGNLVSSDTASVAFHLVQIVAREINQARARNAAYSAEDALQKMEQDPNCGSVLDYIVDQMDPGEREKLFRSIPKHTALPKLENEDAVTGCMRKMHEILKDRVREAVIAGELEHLRRLLGTASRPEFLHYLAFYTEDLERLDTTSRDAIVNYLLSIIAGGSDEDIRETQRSCDFLFVGQYISDSNLDILQKAIARRMSCGVTEPALTAIGAATSLIPDSCRSSLELWLDKRKNIKAPIIKNRLGVPF